MIIMSHEINPDSANKPPTQEMLEEIISFGKDYLREVKGDNIAYMRNPDTTMLIIDNHDKPARRIRDGVIGDYEIWVLKWLDKENPGYGPHTFTTYKFFTKNEGISVKKIFEANGTNGDPREALLQTEITPLPPYLTDPDPEFALIMQSFEGVGEKPKLFGSAEQKIEAVNRFFGGHYEEDQLGLYEVSQDEIEELKELFFNTEPTRDPYFEL